MGAAKIRDEVLPASECKEIFALGTEALVDHFQSVSECQSTKELVNLLKSYYKGRTIDLKEQETALLERLEAVNAASNDANIDTAEFAQQKTLSVARLNEDLDAIREQLSLVRSETQDAKEISEQQLFAYKTSANMFLTSRQKILDSWNENYTASPLKVIDDVDHELVAVPADGRDIGAWINDLLNKSLGDAMQSEGME